MFKQLRAGPIFAIISTIALISCTAFYPRFDNPLNPDIAFPSVGDVVESVKCSVSSYLFERTADMEGEARDLILTELRDKRGTDVDRTFCARSDNWIEPSRWRIALLSPKRGEESFTSCELDRELGPKENPATVDWKGKTVCSPAFKAYKYVRLTKAAPNSGKVYKCEPNGGCKAGTLQQNKGTCAADDPSRFSLDPNGVTKIELTISAVLSGSMNYQRVDADRVDFLQGIIVPGNVAKGFPFPTFKATDKKTNRVALTVVMPQVILKEEKIDEKIKEIIKKLEKNVADASAAKFGIPFEATARLQRVEQLSEEALSELISNSGEYKEKCHERPLKVDFLALKRYIKRIVADQEKRVYSGAPEVALDNMVLTSEFQLVFGATAGTRHLFRILPVLQPPVLSIDPDHTHNLKITFAGAKAKALSTSGVSLIQRCVTRLRNTPAAADAQRFCREPNSILLESIIDAVENKTGGG